MLAPGRNAPLFDFCIQHYIYCLLVYAVCFPTYPFLLTFFLLTRISSLTYLFPLRIDPLRFQAGRGFSF